MFLEKELKESKILYQFSSKLNGLYLIFTVSKIINFDIWRL